jgi:hypothetical protein
MKKEMHYCVICGCEIVRSSNRQKYCMDCAKTIRRINTNRYVKAYYQRQSAIN